MRGGKGKSRGMVLQPAFVLGLEDEKKQTIMDQTTAMLLRYISESGSLVEAAKKVGVSYRNAWGRINALEKSLGQHLVGTKIGGERGGGAHLTREGETLLKEFRRLRKYLFGALGDSAFWSHIGYKLSARNKIKAKIVEIKKGDVTSEVKMRILEHGQLTSIISEEAVEDLQLKEGDEVDAIVKATEVILAKRQS